MTLSVIDNGGEGIACISRGISERRLHDSLGQSPRIYGIGEEVVYAFRYSDRCLLLNPKYYALDADRVDGERDHLPHSIRRSTLKSEVVGNSSNCSHPPIKGVEKLAFLSPEQRRYY